MVSPPPDVGFMTVVYESIQQRRSQRRELEWRNSVAIWTGLLVSAGFVFNRDPAPFEGRGTVRAVVVAVLAVALLALTVLHGLYARLIALSHREDLGRAVEIEKAMGIPFTSESKWITERRFGPSASLQVSLTAALALVLLIAVSA